MSCDFGVIDVKVCAMPISFLVAVWSNPPPSPIGYLSELHGFERQLFYLQL
jgi:hypothetical protein